MDLVREIESAMRAALGKGDAAFYKVYVWNHQQRVALAYSWEKQEILMLVLGTYGYEEMTGEEYLDAAKEINRRLDCFVAPDGNPNLVPLWPGDRRGPVHVYRFKVFVRPKVKLLEALRPCESVQAGFPGPSATALGFSF